jgi:penicillin-binding protein 1A
LPAKVRRPIPPPPRRGVLRRILGWLPSLCLVALAAWVVLFVAMAPRLPDTAALFAESEQAKVTVVASDGEPIAIRGSSGARFVPLAEISPWLVQAVVATEDRRFRHHFGVDPVGLVRALVDNIRAGAVVGGGSTITQQLAKNLYLTPERSLARKLQELTLAIWLETRLSKDQILALYLNRVYLGAGAYGVEAASRRYFGKGAHDVSLSEAAMLAGLLKAPSALAPTNDLDRARQRAAVVLGRMEAEGYITPAQAKAARAKPAKLAPEGGTIGAWFVDWVLDGLTGHLGKPERDLMVFTTLDRRVQQATEQAVERTLAKSAVRNRVDEAAVVVLDTSGAVRAMVGGRDHQDGPFNRAVAARRQPGSAFKPFVYLAALEAGWRPGNMIDDRPVRLKDWQPVNFDGKFRGSITLADAFAHSVNTAAVRLAQTVGPERVAATARQLGVVSAMQPVPSIALGTSEVSLLELTGAYLPFASGGIRRPLFGVTKVEDQRGKVLYRHVPTEVRVVPPEAAAGMHELFVAAVAGGTGHAARLPDRIAAGKTGTTQNGRDAWFVGYAGTYVAGVWLGNDDNRPMKGVQGSNLPAQIWREAMLATPRRAGPPPTPATKPQPENGLEWLIDLVTGAVGGARS